MTEPAIRALIIAFDDVLMPTHALRAEALRDAAAAEGVVLDWAWIIETTRHQSLREVVDAGLPGAADDPTRDTLIGLRADAHYTRAAAQVARLDPDAVARVHATVARGGRVIVRADTSREVVARVLGRTPLLEALAFLVCGDDAGIPHLAAAWQRIDERLHRVGVPREARAALEVRSDARRVAAPHVAQLVSWNPNPYEPLPPS